MTDPALQNQDDFWADLIPLVAAGQVVPVIGAGLLTVDDGGEAVPLLRIVAERLLSRYGLSVPPRDDMTLLRPHHELSDVSRELDRQRKRAVVDCYLPVNEALRALLAQRPPGLDEPFRQLASVEDFHLFVTMTPDDVLASTLDAVRYGGRSATEQVEYAPSGLPKDRRTDMAEPQPPGGTAVLYLLGKAAVSPVYAVHEEDVLEFLHGLQAGLGPVPQRFLAAVRGANLLLIGCAFPDWLSRFLIRIAASQRLGELRGQKDFVVVPDASADAGFALFTETFARNTRLLAMDPRLFVAELARRWQAQQPALAPDAAAAAPLPLRPRGQKPAVFISYSRSDIESVRVLFAELAAVAGDDIAWFDKSEIAPGDEWRERILDAIQGCRLFVPVIPRSEEARTEGVFIEEWRTAVERAKGIDGRAFIVPVFIDQNAEADLGVYVRANRLFRNLDFGFAPGGRLTDALKAVLVRELRALRG